MLIRYIKLESHAFVIDIRKNVKKNYKTKAAALRPSGKSTGVTRTGKKNQSPVKVSAGYCVKTYDNFLNFKIKRLFCIIMSSYKNVSVLFLRIAYPFFIIL